MEIDPGLLTTPPLGHVYVPVLCRNCGHIEFFHKAVLDERMAESAGRGGDQGDDDDVEHTDDQDE